MPKGSNAIEKHVAVLLGGDSPERIISLNSGEACLRGLQALGFPVTPVDPGPDVAEVLAGIEPDVVFNALHGALGEDGKIQGILEYLRLPYTHSGVLASALAMDKPRAKMIASLAGVLVAQSHVVDRFSLPLSHPLEPPYVIKPVSQGSSLGVVLVRDQLSDFGYLLSAEWPYGDMVMVERYVPGRDITCVVMGDKALEVCEIISQNGSFYDYDSKYVSGESKHFCPADISVNVAEKIQAAALSAHKALGCRGVTRSDFRYDDATADIVWLEINTQPGMTETSLLPDVAAASGYSFNDLLRWMVEDASCFR